MIGDGVELPGVEEMHVEGNGYVELPNVGLEMLGDVLDRVVHVAVRGVRHGSAHHGPADSTALNMYRLFNDINSNRLLLMTLRRRKKVI